MSITQEAINLVNGDRRKDYGNMRISFNRIADLWSSYLGITVDSSFLSDCGNHNKIHVAKLLMQITNQQSEELKVIE